MNDALRVLCYPVFTEALPGIRILTGGTLGFALHGAGDSAAHGTVKGVLGVYVRYVASARKPPLGEFQLIATLDGFVHRDLESTARWSTEDDATLAHESTDSDSGNTRVVALGFDVSCVGRPEPSTPSQSTTPHSSGRNSAGTNGASSNGANSNGSARWELKLSGIPAEAKYVEGGFRLGDRRQR